MADMFLFFALVFIFILIIGRALEKIRVPWIFLALLIGAALAIYNPFVEITSSPIFHFLSQLGMYFLLFIIGLKLDIKHLIKESKFIFKSTIFIILFEALCGSMFSNF